MKNDITQIKLLRKIAEEYEYLLETQELSNSQEDQITEILTIAESNNELNQLIIESELRLAETVNIHGGEFKDSDYCKEQQLKLRRYMLAVDEEFDWCLNCL